MINSYSPKGINKEVESSCAVKSYKIRTQNNAITIKFSKGKERWKAIKYINSSSFLGGNWECLKEVSQEIEL